MNKGKGYGKVPTVKFLGQIFFAPDNKQLLYFKCYRLD